MRRVDGATVTCLTLGDLEACRKARPAVKGVEEPQESAEAAVTGAHPGEGPNTRSRTGVRRSRREGDAGTRAERPERPWGAGGGTADKREVR